MNTNGSSVDAADGHVAALKKILLEVCHFVAFPREKCRIIGNGKNNNTVF